MRFYRFIVYSFIAFIGFVGVVPTASAAEELFSVQASCPESFSCPNRNGSALLRQVYQNCDASGDTINVTCKYSNNSTIQLAPSANNCNECVYQNSSSPTGAYCGQWKSTTYALFTCSNG